MHRIVLENRENDFKPWKVTSVWGLSLFLLLGSTHAGFGNPTGGVVVAGSATIGGAAKTLTINQSTGTAIINWQQFSIASGELTKFIVPSSLSATLNRVTGGNPSEIYGTLQSNGQVFLINPSGIVVGPHGRIDTAGFLGSTLDVSNDQFLAGGAMTFSGNSTAGIDNQGSIQAVGGSVYLLANQVSNGGSISAPEGEVGLAAAANVLFQQAGDQHLFVQPTPTGAARAIGVTNSGTIRAASAELRAAGGNAYALAINNSGSIAATGYKKINGKVYLTSDSGTISNSGTLSATTAGQQGGQIQLASNSGAVINSGTLNASATAAGGQGGSVLLKSTLGAAENTVSGEIDAKGGTGGAGGNVEVSGATVQATGTVNTTAPGGTIGMFTIDPATFTVAASGGDETGAQVASTLATTDVTLNADNAVTIDDAITWASATTLTLSTNVAGSAIAINAPISGVNGGLTLDAASASDSITATAAVNVANFILESGSWNQNSSTLPAFTASQNFELQGTSTFLRVTGGNGTTSPYQITDVYGLQGLASPSNNLLSANAELVNNINAGGTATWNTDAGFVPIGNTDSYYSGTFNGQGFVINGLTINSAGDSDIGLFGVASGVLENVGLNNVQITGGSNVGGLVGSLGNDDGGTPGTGSISNAFSTGNVSGNAYVGGLAGLNHGTSITTSYTGGTVSGGSFVGGMVGSGLSAITNCYSTSAVTASYGPVGGLEGENYYGGSITDCYSSGAVSGTSEVGGLLGRNLGGSVSNSFWDTDTSGISSPTGGIGSYTDSGVTGEPTASLLSASTYSDAGWNIGTSLTGNTWVIFDGQTRPMLAMEYSTTISNAHQLQLIGLNATTLTGNYTLAGNVDLSGTTNASDIWGTSTGSGAGFVPIGLYDGDSNGPNTFSGTFNGQGFTISGLYINTPGSDDAGLFGDTANGSILENVGLTNVTVNGGDYTGGLVGVCNSTLTDVSSTGSVTGTTYVGGLLGILYGSLNEGSSGGTVNGDGSDIGGLVGYFQSGSIANAYSTANVTAGASSDSIGGLVGINYGTISNTYSTGTITAGSGSTDVGALIGTNSGTIDNSFWDTSTAGVTLGVGSDPTNTTPGVTAATTTDLESETYILANAPTSPTWNFSTVWTTNGGTTTPELLGGATVSPPPTGTTDSLSGTVYIDSGLTPDLSDSSVDLIFDGTLLGSTTISNSGTFTFSISAADLTSGVLLTDAADKANTYYQAATPLSTITGIDLWGSTLRVVADTASNAALGQAIGSLQGDGINYAVSGSNLSTTSGVNMSIVSNYGLAGNITVAGTLSTGVNANLTGGSATLTGQSVALSGTSDLSGTVNVVSTAGGVAFDGFGTANAPATAGSLTLTSAGSISFLDSYLSLTGGNLTATGTGFASATLSTSLGGSDGVDIFSSVINAQGGSITLNGTAGYFFNNDPSIEGVSAGTGVNIGSSTVETTGTGSITLTGNGGVPGTIASLTGLAGVNISDNLNTGGTGTASTISVVSGALTINGTVSSGSAGNGVLPTSALAILIGGGSQVTATGNGGTVSLTGNSSGSTAFDTSSSGAVDAGVQFGDGTSTGTAISVATNGSLSIHGTGGAVNSNSATSNDDTGSANGVNIDGSTQITAGAGSNLSIHGTGGSSVSSSAYTGSANGLDVSGGADAVSVITASNGGSLTLAGVGGTIHSIAATGSVSANPSAEGVDIGNDSVVTANGNASITITGTGGTVTGSGLVGSASGVSIGSSKPDGSTSLASDTGNIVVTGTGGTSPSLAIGIVVHGTDGGIASVDSTSGTITFTGTGGGGYAGDGVLTGEYVPNYGTAIVDNVDLTTGSGAINITGTGGANSFGVAILDVTNDSAIDTAPSAPVIEPGGALDVDSLSNGLETDAAITALSGPVTVEETGGNLILGPSAHISSSGAGNNITLVAGTQNSSPGYLVNDSSLGAAAISATDGANYYLYSSDPSSDELGGITAPPADTFYGATYPSNPTVTGNGAILYYAAAPGDIGYLPVSTSVPPVIPPADNGDGSNVVPPAIIPQTSDVAPQTPSSILATLVGGSVAAPFGFPDTGTIGQTDASAGSLASASGNSGQVGSGDAAQLGGGGVNNVSNPAASGALNLALGPAVHTALIDALTAFGDWTGDTAPGDDSTASGSDQGTTLSSGDVVEIGDSGVKSIPLSQAPKSLQNALKNGVLDSMPGNGH